MNCMDFNPYLIKERNHQVFKEVNSPRFEQRLRNNRGSSRSWFFALARNGTLPLLRGVKQA